MVKAVVRLLYRRVLLTAAMVAIPASASCGSGDSAPVEGTDQSSARDALVASTITVGTSAWGVAVDAERNVVRVSDPSRGVLVTVDAGGTVIGEYRIGGRDPRAAGVQVAGGRVWIAILGGSVTAVDPGSGATVATAAVGPGEPAALLVRDGTVWVPLHGPQGGLARLDQQSLGPLEPIALPESGFAISDGAGDTVWVAGLDRRAFAIDARTAAITHTVDVGAAPRGIAAGAGSVWVTVRDDNELVRIDPDSGDVEARVAVGSKPWPVAFGAGFVWVATADGRVLQIDPTTNDIVAEADGSPEPRAIAVGLGAVWITSQRGALTRLPLPS